MWKIIAGVSAVALIALFFLMRSGDKDVAKSDMPGTTASATTSVSTNMAASKSASATPPAPDAYARPSAAPASSDADGTAPQSTKMSTTGIVLVGKHARSN